MTTSNQPIKANELRIGNLIRYGNPIHKDLPIYKITGIFEHTFYLDGDAVSSNNSNILGIPLTKELLLELSFIKHFPSGSLFVLGTFIVNIFGREGIYESRNHIKIEYLHQLQNLYFTLEGKELKINNI